MLAPQATDLLAIHPPYSEKQRSQPCRLPHERKLCDQTKDDADKEPREERSCGRSQTSLYNGTRTHLSLEKDAPVSRSRRAHSLSPHLRRTPLPIRPDLIYDRHRCKPKPHVSGSAIFRSDRRQTQMWTFGPPNSHSRHCRQISGAMLFEGTSCPRHGWLACRNISST